MIASRLRALLAEWIVGWRAGGELPHETSSEAPRWYELSPWY